MNLAFLEIFELLFELFEGLELFGFLIEICMCAICGFFGLLADFISLIFNKTSDAVEAADDALEATADALESAPSAVGPVSFSFVMLIILLIMGVFTGYVISIVFPERIFTSSPVTGISLLITPIGAGLFMSLCGAWKLKHGHASTFIGTFFGGALFGFAAAGMRLAMMGWA